MEAHLREVVLPAYVPDALAGVYLPQDPDLVFCAVSLSFHGLWAWLSQRLTHHLAQITEVTSGNGLGDKGFPSSPCLSVGEAKISFTYVCPAFIEPKVIDYKGQKIEFGEAWVEKRSKPEWFLVWIPYRKIVRGYELCFTLKTGDQALDGWFVIGDRGRSLGTISSKNTTKLFSESLGLKDADEIIPDSLEMSLIDNWKEPRPKNLTITFGKKL